MPYENLHSGNRLCPSIFAFASLAPTFSESPAQKSTTAEFPATSEASYMPYPHRLALLSASPLRKSRSRRFIPFHALFVGASDRTREPESENGCGWKEYW